MGWGPFNPVPPVAGFVHGWSAPALDVRYGQMGHGPLKHLVGESLFIVTCRIISCANSH